jgi:hypothetical protein
MNHNKDLHKSCDNKDDNMSETLYTLYTYCLLIFDILISDTVLTV